MSDGSGLDAEVADVGASSDAGPPDVAPDGDVFAGCAHVTILGSAFAFCQGPRGWTNAAEDCNTMSMELAHIASATENAAVRDAANQHIGEDKVWIGGSERVADGTWIWSDGTVFWPTSDGGGSSYVNWAYREPNNAGGIEDCLEMWNTGKWNDYRCDTAHPFVCRE